MEAAARAARLGDRLLSLAAFVLILCMFSYGGYSLWDSYMVNQGAFLGKDLLQYKPSDSGDTGGANYSLQELIAINPDTRGWITIDNTHIDYPLVQGETDMEYINKDVMGEFALSGAIFLSYLNTGDFSDPYSLLYGHHMDNGAMFSDVLEFLDGEYFGAHTTGTLYLPDKTYKITLFACMEADGYDRLIYGPGPDYDNGPLLEYIQTSANQYRDIGVTAEDSIIGLSTCVDIQTTERAVLFGRLEEK